MVADFRFESIVPLAMKCKHSYKVFTSRIHHESLQIESSHCDAGLHIPPLAMSTTPTNGGMPQPPPEHRDKSMTSDEDFTQLNDPEFLAMRRRVREELEHTPEHALTTELKARYEALNDEFLRRASAAWTQAI
jgi:hypothetical protein